MLVRSVSHKIKGTTLYSPCFLLIEGVSGLHYELLDLATEISPSSQEKEIREQIVYQIRGAVKTLWKGVIVNVFGSCGSNSYLPMR